MRTAFTLGSVLALAATSWAIPPSEAGRVPTGPPPLDPLAAAPMDATGALDSTWAYLRAKYDRDGDGRVTSAEYDRGGVPFQRLDRNGDGVVDPDDFRSRRPMGSMAAQGLVFMYFQTDDEPSELPLAELERAIAAYDTSGDGVVDRAEFTCAFEARKVDVGRMARMLRDVDAWEGLIEGVDDDGDGALASAELVGFFTDRDDGDGVWRIQGQGRRQRGGGDRAGGRARTSGPAEGTMAPDFALQPPDGGETVTLSGFIGQRPVALIFGSYT